jgi:hypothetical protein
VGVVVWVCIEMHKNKRDFRRRWKRLGKEKSKIGKRLDEMIKEDSKINKTLVGIDERLSKEDSKINKTLVGIEERLSKEDSKIKGIEERVGSLSKEDEKINERISKISETDEAIRSDVAKMRPLLNVASVDASGNLSIANDRQFCIDTECISSHDIPKMKKAPLPPIGSVWRCDVVKVDAVHPMWATNNNAQVSVTFTMEDQTFPNSIPSYTLNLRFTDINGDRGPFPSIPVEEDPTNTSKSKILNFYPHRDDSVNGMTVSQWSMGTMQQRMFPMVFNGYDIGSTCTFNFIGWCIPDLKKNSPAVFTRVS